MKFRVTLDSRISSTAGALDDDVRFALDAAMAEMFRLSGTTDPAIILDFNKGGSLVISCVVDVNDVDEAVPPASTNIRSALHSAEIGTSQWPKPNDPRWRVEFIGSRAEAVLSSV